MGKQDEVVWRRSPQTMGFKKHLHSKSFKRSDLILSIREAREEKGLPPAKALASTRGYQRLPLDKLRKIHEEVTSDE